jgi:hypothetical protein
MVERASWTAPISSFCGDAALADVALEIGEGVLDGVEEGRVGWKEHELVVAFLKEKHLVADDGCVVDGGIIEDDDGVWWEMLPQQNEEESKVLSVHTSLVLSGGDEFVVDDPVEGEGCDEGDVPLPLWLRVVGPSC